jgi:hypothetical protein
VSCQRSSSSGIPGSFAMRRASNFRAIAMANSSVIGCGQGFASPRGLFRASAWGSCNFLVWGHR